MHLFCLSYSRADSCLSLSLTAAVVALGVVGESVAGESRSWDDVLFSMRADKLVLKQRRSTLKDPISNPVEQYKDRRSYPLSWTDRKLYRMAHDGGPFSEFSGSSEPKD